MAVTYLQPAEAFGPITLTLGTTAVVLTGTQVLISSTLYARIFCTNVFLAVFLCTYVEKSCQKDVCMKNWRV